ncbi:MAG: GGDEF domain-containing protein [Candidatus Thiodiazotropha sp.]|jgi:diguanylate cyclase (GGDEF)-like protein
MRHFLASVDTLADVDTFLEQSALLDAAGASSSILIQIFTGRVEAEWIESLLMRFRAALPSALTVGVTSGGEIAAGHALDNATVISLLCFTSARVHPLQLDCPRGAEYDTGAVIGRALNGLPQLRGVLLLAPPMAMDSARLLDGIESQLPGVNLFGGGAGTDGANDEALVFGSSGISRSAVIAIGLQGETLQIETDVFFGWEMLGPRMTLTDVEDNRIRTIDGQPAFNVYSRYLSIEPGEELFLLEFPLLLEREGTIIARNPVSSDEHGAVTMVADVQSGESARLGYLDVDAVVENARGAVAALAAFRPEAILLYSCICRRFFLQQEIELETLPFQQLAPVAGFFTYGEFSRLGGHPQLLNSSQVVVALREGGGVDGEVKNSAEAYGEADRIRLRHIRITSRLFQFISALTEEVEAANLLLQHKAEHDALTGALNRHRLEEDLRRELSLAKRHGHSLSLVMFDIDHFKRVNDQQGHAAGDYVLRTLAHTVLEILRLHDIMFRYGGEEFLLLLPQIDLPGALVMAERLRKTIEALRLQYNEKPLPPLTVSFGVASAPRHGMTPFQLLEAVDAALYRAKQRGRNRVEQAND